ncbi:16S rRNA (uracil(1498)-N(3))-methyltransferase [Candidatus Desulfovibrio trichonymphae]|uniref:Ribosomal RNA small subunit methyltransferase E n=1 Tax=Candidatus Desulfovibrio trichonymphae TaxID=1725232 RepID=A0A1J1DY53_9BACT|nr:16S rRNA (uracil(1498)-N(3))-methyltransferase [Candidatus Desulfovibrio trichonymphae]BAV92022.1 16S rRNA (uracil1498-N3)-methyltransferase [Candidatus Desulfovibrio trichonymphae]GHV00499.1 ribosomal RNA small subunit methyltransferase E [Deltaproteobacteria bacterium]
MNKACFYLPPTCWGQDVQLEGKEAKQLINVLRLAPGCEVCLLDGQGRVGRFVIRKIRKTDVLLERLEERLVPRPASRAILALAFSKAVRCGFFIEKAVELGAHAIWIWQADHSHGKLSHTPRQSLLSQLTAGAKQCRNPWLSEIRTLHAGIHEVVALSTGAEHRILLWEMQENVQMLPQDAVGQQGLSVYIIGPEGGFSQRELTMLRTAKFKTFSLGARILRCETAAILCLGIHWWAAQLHNNSGKYTGMPS